MSNESCIECYGKFPDDPRYPKTICKKRSSCELGGPCLDCSREEKSNIHYNFQYESVGSVSFDPNRSDSDDEQNVAAKAYFEATDASSGSSDLNLLGIDIPDDSVDIVKTVIEKLSEFYFYSPAVFEALMNSIMLNKSQSDLAREKHISRQCENKRLLRELGIAQKRNDVQHRRDRELAEAKKSYENKLQELRHKDSFLRTLSNRDWLIYKLRFIDGCTVKSTARQANVTERTVYRVSAFLHSNLDNSVTVDLIGK